jgi:hypothetical protein
VNPHNVKPVYNETDKEYFYPAESEVTKNVPGMLKTLAWLYTGMLTLSLLLVSKRKMPDDIYFNNLAINDETDHDLKETLDT